MERGEVTLALFTDYSKAFDTVDYKTILTKICKLGFSKNATRWMFSYLTNRIQYVQINDQRSSDRTVLFGVPQGSVLGPILFNLYVTDLQDIVHGSVLQYADDTTYYTHCKPNNIDDGIALLSSKLNSLKNWSCDNNLAYNVAKSKITLFGTSQMLKKHDFSNFPHIECNGNHIERVKEWKMLGIYLDENLHWEFQLNEILKGCYQFFENFAQPHIRKHLI